MKLTIINLAIFALIAAILVGCTSEVVDEPEYAVTSVEEAAAVRADWERVFNTDRSALLEMAGLTDCAEMPLFYKDENGLWYPIDPTARITSQEMNEKIMGYGWERWYSYDGVIDEDGIYRLCYPDGEVPDGIPYGSKFAFYPGFVRRYDYRFWGHDFLYHDDSRLDTDAPIIGYTSTDDRDWLLPIKLINDISLIMIKTHYRYCGNGVYEPTGIAGCYLLRRVSADVVAVWEERHWADYWGN